MGSPVCSEEVAFSSEIADNALMYLLHSTTASHQKGKHLSYEERVIIHLRVKDSFTTSRFCSSLLHF